MRDESGGRVGTHLTAFYGTTGHGIVSVKSGETIGVSMICHPKGAIERERAGIGVVRSQAEPTKPMVT